MGVGTDYRGTPRVFAASTTGHGNSAANATVVATARSPGSFRGKLRRTNHGKPRKSAETAVAISTAIRRHCHGDAAITTEVRGCPRELSRQFPRTFSRSNLHGHPWPSASIATANLRYAATSTEACGSPQLLPQHVPRFCPCQTPSCQSCPRPSVPVAVSLAVARGHEFCRGSCNGCFR